MLSCILTTLVLGCFSFLSFSTAATPGVSTDINNVAFYLYANPSNVNDATLLTYNDINSITNSAYDKNKNLIVYTSGFIQNYTTDQSIKNAYINNGFLSNNNIIVVDWGALSGNQADLAILNITQLSLLGALPLYIDVVQNVQTVGLRLQQFLTFLSTNDQLTVGFGNVHLVGQSLGAHVVGVAGNLMIDIGSTIGRITGTEPASPLFQASLVPIVPASQRLTAASATFVQIVHTNQGEAGWLGSLGHIDFFVNGGGPITQPACLQPANLTNLFCSHNLAVTYYALSIYDVSRNMTAYCCQLLSVITCLLPTWLGGLLCSSTVQFGEYVSSSATGNYYINITV